MELELKLKHLAPYLPYKLYCQTLDNNEKHLTKKELVFLSPDGVKVEFMKGFPLRVLNFNEIKPILRPLSDLFKLIDWDNNNDPYMIGYKYGISTFKENNKYIYVDEYEADYCSSPKAYVDITSFNWWLFEKHFDVFGLIDKGLAVDYNTL